MIHRQTWQHPKSKRWHCIDYAVVRQKDRKLVLDAEVKRGAECQTDHQLLRVKVRMSRVRLRRRSKNKMSMRFNVSKLFEQKNESDAAPTCTMFQEAVSSKAKELWTADSPIDDQWNALSSALTEAAKTILGTEKRKKPDWFLDSAEIIEPLLSKRNQLYSRWLSTGLERDKKKFTDARRSARQAVRMAKNDWFKKKAEEAHTGRFSGKTVWKCIRDMQRGRRGLVPARLSRVRNRDGFLCTTALEQHQRWREHFTDILNIQTPFNTMEIEKIKQRPLRQELAKLPSMEDLLDAVDKLKNGKAGGKSGILPEMLKAACGDNVFAEMLLKLLHRVWEEKSVPKDWVDAILVPVPKKGDLTMCDNWRGISLLDVVGKVIARIINKRLQHLAEEMLPDSQCGFRKNRGCPDMIFTVRQLVEKTWEHKPRAFLIYIDLKKAYDSVPRAALWAVLKKLGIPESLIELIGAFHNNMKAQIRLDDCLLHEIDVENGLRQGCCMAPVLFNLYSCAVIERWKEELEGEEGTGVYLRYKHDKKLFRRYTRNANTAMLTECQFADDAALLATSREAAILSLKAYIKVATSFGLCVSIPKTKLMVTGRVIEEEDRAPIVIDEDKVVDHVNEFPYLGSVIQSSGRVDVDIERRITLASKAFGALRKSVFMDRDLNLQTKRLVYNACVLSVLLYAAECWIPLRKHYKKLDSFHHRCVRTVLGISNRQQWMNRITSREVRRRWGDQQTISQRLTARRLEWLGHLARMSETRIPQRCLFGWLPQPRPRGGPRRRWRDVVKTDLRKAGIEEDQWFDLANSSRARWRAAYQDVFEVDQEMSGPHQPVSPRIYCPVCNRRFRREGDRKRHKCTAERQKPVCEQVGAVQCDVCSRWFRSRGGLAVHRCGPSGY